VIYTPLLTDFYQLTMAYGYWKLNMHEQEACFHLLFRKNPFNGHYALSCGLASMVEFLKNWRFQADDLAYLASLKNAHGDVLFAPEYIEYLRQLRFSCDLDAIPEGTIVFANEPLIRIQGPILQCQLIETALLNMVNFQTLIATKASRVCRAAQGDAVIEFGMRRAQGPDGATSASRAAYIGGCVATSNTLAGKLYDIPVRGTHAHSWVTAFPSELEAFQAYADIMPHNCTLLVDTFGTLEGVKNAIKIGKKLREQGGDLLGIRLDSGDMASLSIQARELLDQAEFENTGILASNSLDEYVIADLKQKGAKINSWGVGTNLATAYDQPALDGVYKLCAIKNINFNASANNKNSNTENNIKNNAIKNGAHDNEDSEWIYKLKLSEQEIKISNPGRHQVRRFLCGSQYVMDVIYDLDLGISDVPEVIVLDKALQHKIIDDYDAAVDLLIPIMRRGVVIEQSTSIHDIRKHAMQALEHFHDMDESFKRENKVYVVALEKRLFDLKQELIKKTKA
jgi:nicotinate phosphoribosyltransferase